MPDPAGYEHLARRGGERGCRSWSSTPRGGRGAPGRSGCRDRAPGGGSRRNVGRCGNCALVDARCADGARHGALHVRFMVVMPALSRLALPPRRCGKNPLPAPVARRRRELPVDRVRQPDAAESRGQCRVTLISAPRRCSVAARTQSCTWSCRRVRPLRAVRGARICGPTSTQSAVPGPPRAPGF